MVVGEQGELEKRESDIKAVYDDGKAGRGRKKKAQLVEVKTRKKPKEGKVKAEDNIYENYRSMYNKKNQYKTICLVKCLRL